MFGLTNKAHLCVEARSFSIGLSTLVLLKIGCKILFLCSLATSRTKTWISTFLLGGWAGKFATWLSLCIEFRTIGFTSLLKAFTFTDLCLVGVGESNRPFARFGKVYPQSLSNSVTLLDETHKHVNRLLIEPGNQLIDFTRIVMLRYQGKRGFLGSKSIAVRLNTN